MTDMDWLRSIGSRLRALVRGRNFEQRLDAELRAHLEMSMEESIRRGLRLEEARYAALRNFGGIDQAKEACREQRGLAVIGSLTQDMRYAVRQLRRNRGFTALAVLTLALGIGSTTAIFSVIDAVLLRASPYQDASRLVEISEIGPRGKEQVSPGDFNEWQQQSGAVQKLAAHKQWEFRVLTGEGEPDEVWAAPVTPGLFEVLGVRAVYGRAFGANENQVAVLGYEYWRSHFHSDRGVLGKAVALDGKPYTVIGVAPPGLEYPNPNTQIWIPLRLTPAEQSDHEDHSLSVIARLAAGAGIDRAQSAMDLQTRRLAAEYPTTNAGWTARVEPFRSRPIEGTLRSAIFALLGAVTFVLLIACANVASMLLARGSARQSEMAIRSALGARRPRLIRQLIVEILPVALLAGLTALLLARWGLSIIVEQI